MIFRLRSRHNRAIRLAKFLRAGLRKVAINSGSGVQSSEKKEREKKMKPFNGLRHLLLTDKKCGVRIGMYANIKLTNAQNVTREFLSAEAIFTWVVAENNLFLKVPPMWNGGHVVPIFKPATNRITYQGPRVPIPCPPRQSGLERIAWFDPQIKVSHLVVLSKGSRNSWWFCWEEISISCLRRFSNLGRFLPFGQLRVKDLKHNCCVILNKMYMFFWYLLEQVTQEYEKFTPLQFLYICYQHEICKFPGLNPSEGNNFLYANFSTVLIFEPGQLPIQHPVSLYELPPTHDLCHFLAKCPNFLFFCFSQKREIQKLLPRTNVFSIGMREDNLLLLTKSQKMWQLQSLLACYNKRCKFEKYARTSHSFCK